MRQIILDTETTGLSPKDGHRIIEIGCVELIDRGFTGNDFHKYINPERDVEQEAVNIHGITDNFLADKELFKDVAKEFIDYIKGGVLIIHNAPFDVGFLDHELKMLKKPFKPISEYALVFDTLTFARKKHPGKKNNLDALCKRYHVDNTNRQYHGALLDARLLADVFLSMTGGQMSLFDEGGGPLAGQRMGSPVKKTYNPGDRKPLSIIYANNEELEQHTEFMNKITGKQTTD